MITRLSFSSSMKTFTLLLASFTSVSFALAVEPPRFQKSTKMRDAVTHDELAQKMKMAAHSDPIRDLGPAMGNLDEDPAKRVTDRDLVKESTVLNYRGFLTLVPKRAVIHTPANYENRFKPSDDVQVQSWADFFKGNRGWIRTIEVSREQAMGLAPMDEAIMTALQESTQVVVATFKGGPISVMPYVAPEPEETEKTEGTGEAKTQKTGAADGQTQGKADETKPSSKP
jgi:hypothetical protein